MWFGIGVGVWLAISMILLGAFGGDDIECLYAAVLWPIYAAAVPLLLLGQWIGGWLRHRD